MSLYAGFIQLGAGLSVGLAGLAAGFAIGIVGDAGVRGTAQQPRLFIGMVSDWWTGLGGCALGGWMQKWHHALLFTFMGRQQPGAFHFVSVVHCRDKYRRPRYKLEFRSDNADALTQILILIFAEVLGLYGLIVALILNTRVTDAPAVSIEIPDPISVMKRIERILTRFLLLARIAVQLKCRTKPSTAARLHAQAERECCVALAACEADHRHYTLAPKELRNADTEQC